MEDKILLRELGRTGIMLTPVGLGCWQFSKQKNFAGRFWHNLDDNTISNIVSLALAGGVNWFDTAELYGKGESEKALSGALQAAGIKPGEVFIATKWSPFFRFSTNIGKTINDRIIALAPYPIDLHQIHNPYGFSALKNEMEAMADLIERRLIKSIGVSNFSARQMEQAWKVLDKKGIPLASNQVRYNLLDRKIESTGILDSAKRLGITIIAYSPLAQGILSGKFHDNPELVKNTGLRRYTPLFTTGGLKKSFRVVKLVKVLAIKYHVTPSQIALNWLIHYHEGHIVAIPGATNKQQIKEDVETMRFRISDEDMAILDKESSEFK